MVNSMEFLVQFCDTSCAKQWIDVILSGYGTSFTGGGKSQANVGTHTEVNVVEVIFRYYSK